MNLATTIVYALAGIFGIAYLYVDHKVQKRRRLREQKFIAWMNGRGPYPED